MKWIVLPQKFLLLRSKLAHEEWLIEKSEWTKCYQNISSNGNVEYLQKVNKHIYNYSIIEIVWNFRIENKILCRYTLLSIALGYGLFFVYPEFHVNNKMKHAKYCNLNTFAIACAISLIHWVHLFSIVNKLKTFAWWRALNQNCYFCCRTQQNISRRDREL